MEIGVLFCLDRDIELVILGLLLRLFFICIFLWVGGIWGNLVYNSKVDINLGKIGRKENLGD